MELADSAETSVSHAGKISRTLLGSKLYERISELPAIYDNGEYVTSLPRHMVFNKLGILPRNVWAFRAAQCYVSGIVLLSDSLFGALEHVQFSRGEYEPPGDITTLKPRSSRDYTRENPYPLGIITDNGMLTLITRASLVVCSEDEMVPAVVELIKEHHPTLEVFEFSHSPKVLKGDLASMVDSIVRSDVVVAVQNHSLIFGPTYPHSKQVLRETPNYRWEKDKDGVTCVFPLIRWDLIVWLHCSSQVPLIGNRCDRNLVIARNTIAVHKSLLNQIVYTSFENFDPELVDLSDFEKSHDRELAILAQNADNSEDTPNHPVQSLLTPSRVFLPDACVFQIHSAGGKCDKFYSRTVVELPRHPIDNGQSSGSNPNDVYGVSPCRALDEMRKLCCLYEDRLHSVRRVGELVPEIFEQISLCETSLTGIFDWVNLEISSGRSEPRYQMFEGSDYEPLPENAHPKRGDIMVSLGACKYGLIRIADAQFAPIRFSFDIVSSGLPPIVALSLESDELVGWKFNILPRTLRKCLRHISNSQNVRKLLEAIQLNKPTPERCEEFIPVLCKVNASLQGLVEPCNERVFSVEVRTVAEIKDLSQHFLRKPADKTRPTLGLSLAIAKYLCVIKYLHKHITSVIAHLEKLSHVVREFLCTLEDTRRTDLWMCGHLSTESVSECPVCQCSHICFSHFREFEPVTQLSYQREIVRRFKHSFDIREKCLPESGAKLVAESPLHNSQIPGEILLLNWFARSRGFEHAHIVFLSKNLARRGSPFFHFMTQNYSGNPENFNPQSESDLLLKILPPRTGPVTAIPSHNLGVLAFKNTLNRLDDIVTSWPCTKYSPASIDLLMFPTGIQTDAIIAAPDVSFEEVDSVARLCFNPRGVVQIVQLKWE